jgi:hypothetical protein
VLVQIRCMGLYDSPSLKGPGSHGLTQDMMNVLHAGSRIARAMDDFMQYRATESRKSAEGGAASSSPSGTGWVALKNAIQFRKSINNQAFDNSSHIFAQLEKIGPALGNKIYQYCHDFSELADASEIAIQAWTGRKAPFGAFVLQQVHRIPQYIVLTAQDGYVTDTRCARMTVTFNCHEVAAPASKVVHLIIGSLKDELIYYRKARVTELPIIEKIDVPLGTQLKAFMIDDQTGHTIDRQNENTSRA